MQSIPRGNNRCILSKFYIKPQQCSSVFVDSQGCILSKFYIKPQLSVRWFLCHSVVSYRNSTSNHNRGRITQHKGRSCILSKFYIEPQQQRVDLDDTFGCILSKFYIKPQHFCWWIVQQLCCILSKFYIKPQPNRNNDKNKHGCILSKFYIKPQHVRCQIADCPVVSYRNSTSNHNGKSQALVHLGVVSYRNSTSNHNL